MESSVLRNRNFLLLWMAQVLSQTAQNAILYILMVFTEQRTGSSLHMGVLILSAIVPSVLFGMAAGVFVDRWRKKTVLVTTNILRGVAVMGYLVFNQTLAVIYMVNFVFSTISQFFAPAEAAAIPVLVSKKQLISANGLFNLTFTGSQLAGFVLVAPLLVKLAGPQTTFIVLALVFVVAAALVSALPASEPGGRSRAPLEGVSILRGIAKELHDGWQLLRSDSVISLSLLHLTLMSTLMLIMGMLAPGYVSRVLDLGVEDAVYIFAPAGFGMLIGIILLPRLAVRLSKERLVDAGLILLALSLVGLALSGRGGHYLTALGFGSIGYGSLMDLATVVALVMIAALFMGFAFAMVNVPAQTIVQERAPVDMRGRIFAAQLVFGSVASLLPLLFLGGLADLLGIGVVILLVAACVLSVGVYTHLRVDRLIALEKRGEISEPSLLVETLEEVPESALREDGR